MSRLARAVPLTTDEAVQEAMRLYLQMQAVRSSLRTPGQSRRRRRCQTTMEMLRAARAPGRAEGGVGLMWDPARRQPAHARRRRGHGRNWRSGAGRACPGDAPFVGQFEVEYLSDGRCALEGPMMNGMKVELGPIAGLRIEA